MRILIITVAGCSTRFSKSIKKDTLKCIYYQNDIRESLLYRMLHHPVSFDKYIIVGGYKFEELQETFDNWFQDIKEKVVLVDNPHYKDYGSGYSLYCGIREAFKHDFSEIVFAEGDLFVDSHSFAQICNSKKSVISCNNESILANKSVALYFDILDEVHYLYDTGHSAFEINEPFVAIYNSGQVWKFADSHLVHHIYDNMTLDDWKRTNLVFVEKYFRKINSSEYEIIHFNKWVNCNTVNDYKKSISNEEIL